MRKLSAAEIKQVSEALFKGHPIPIEVEDFDMTEFAQQQADAETKKSSKDDKDAAPN